ncbi:MAG: nucleotide exchange factor GrpE [Verrucomicrobia bacterium]|nr:nucleotide exchange factor GrpE [Verrucomicrobiota bacterium]
MTADASAVKTAAEIAAERAAAMAATQGAPFTPSESAEPAPVDVTALEAEVAQLKDQNLRARADFENSRKRLQREKEDAIKFANSNLLERLLPVLDAFELGLGEARKHEAAAPIVQGFDMVLRQALDFMKEQGAEPIDAVGQPFDPNLHQAMGQLESDTVAEGLVSQQLRRGWKLRDRLLRPSMVFVSKGKGATELPHSEGAAS